MTIPISRQVAAKERSETPMTSASEVKRPMAMRSQRTRWVAVSPHAPR